MFHRNSPLNIFPLNFFLDSVVGFWDSQKKLVADLFPSENVVYMGVGPREVFEWYSLTKRKKGSRDDPSDTPIDEEDFSLISADGVHPNARFYALWASSLGKKLAVK